MRLTELLTRIRKEHSGFIKLDWENRLPSGSYQKYTITLRPNSTRVTLASGTTKYEQTLEILDFRSTFLVREITASRKIVPTPSLRIETYESRQYNS